MTLQTNPPRNPGSLVPWSLLPVVAFSKNKQEGEGEGGKREVWWGLWVVGLLGCWLLVVGWFVWTRREGQMARWYGQDGKMDKMVKMAGGEDGRKWR
jgi:hypothetical protein